MFTLSFYFQIDQLSVLLHIPRVTDNDYNLGFSLSLHAFHDVFLLTI